MQELHLTLWVVLVAAVAKHAAEKPGLEDRLRAGERAPRLEGHRVQGARGRRDERSRAGRGRAGNLSLRLLGRDGALLVDGPVQLRAALRDVTPDLAHPDATRGSANVSAALGEDRKAANAAAERTRSIAR